MLRERLDVMPDMARRPFVFGYLLEAEAEERVLEGIADLGGQVVDGVDARRKEPVDRPELAGQTDVLDPDFI